MGNNKEIRQRMETYRTILLVLNWIGAVAIFIVGIVLANSKYTQGIGIGVIIGSVVLGIIVHFLVNDALAIPFILLNNGDILESMKKDEVANVNSNNSTENVSIKNKEEDIIQPEIKYTVEEENKNAEIDRLEKLFESSTDEKEKGIIAKKLYDLGKVYYWRYIPKDKK